MKTHLSRRRGYFNFLFLCHWIERNRSADLLPDGVHNKPFKGKRTWPLISGQLYIKNNSSSSEGWGCLFSEGKTEPRPALTGRLKPGLKSGECCRYVATSWIFLAHQNSSFYHLLATTYYVNARARPSLQPPQRQQIDAPLSPSGTVLFMRF